MVAFKVQRRRTHRSYVRNEPSTPFNGRFPPVEKSLRFVHVFPSLNSVTDDLAPCGSAVGRCDAVSGMAKRRARNDCVIAFITSFFHHYQKGSSVNFFVCLSQVPVLPRLYNRSPQVFSVLAVRLCGRSGFRNGSFVSIVTRALGYVHFIIRRHCPRYRFDFLFQSARRHVQLLPAT